MLPPPLPSCVDHTETICMSPHTIPVDPSTHLAWNGATDSPVTHGAAANYKKCSSCGPFEGFEEKPATFLIKSRYNQPRRKMSPNISARACAAFTHVKVYPMAWESGKNHARLAPQGSFGDVACHSSKPLPKTNCRRQSTKRRRKKSIRARPDLGPRQRITCSLAVYPYVGCE